MFSLNRKIPIFLLSLVIGSSLYLIWNTYFHDQPIIGCQKGSGCNQVLASHWSQVLNIPILILGLLTYAALFILLIVGKKTKLLATIYPRLIIYLSYLIIFAGVWFFCIQVFILHAYCVWCCSIHTLAILAAVLVIIQNRVTVTSLKLAVPALAIVSIGALALTQHFFPSQVKTHRTNLMAGLTIAEEGSNITLFNGKLSVAKEDLPTLSTSDSKTICLILSDHTCPHCLEFQREITAQKSQIEKDLTIYILPSFQSKQAREINRLLIIARRVDPKVYESALTAIQSGSLALDHTEIRSFLDKGFNGQFNIYHMSFSPWSYKIMDLSAELMSLNQEQAQVSAFPQVITANHVVEGVISISDLIVLSKKPAPAKLQQSNAPIRDPLLNNNASSLVIAKSTFHLGRITKNNIGKDTVTLSNPGEEPIQISKIRTSCGCISVSKDPITIAPNSEAKLPFEFATKKFLGNVTHKIFLHQEGVRLPISIPITVDVWLPFKIFPYSSKLGSIAEGASSGMQTINLINSTQQPVDLTLSEEQDPLLNDIKLETIIEGTHYKLTFCINSMPNHPIDTHLNLKTSHPDCPDLNLPVNASSSLATKDLNK